MCGNRVEELESRVQELEASVRGLTDELVECKVRLRELEDVDEADDLLAGDPDEGDDEPTEADAGEPTEADAGEPVEADEGGSEHPELTDGTEVMHADDSPEDDSSEAEETDGEASKPEDDDSQDDTEDTGSDIIVA